MADSTVKTDLCCVEGCGRKRDHTRFCTTHRSRYYGTTGRCVIEGCSNRKSARGMCVTHYSRWKKGDKDIERPVRAYGAGFTSKEGYRIVYVDGERIKEHRHVMQVLLGRPLYADENVHHINGDKLDNRPENLELWSTSQPRGQRVTDKVAWAREILARYEGCATSPTQL